MSRPELLDAVLGTPSKIKLIRALLAFEEPITGREAARRAKVSQRPAHRSLTDLVSRGVVRKEVRETHHLFTLNTEHQIVREGIIPLFQAEVGHMEAVQNELARVLTPLTSGSMPDVRSAVLASRSNSATELDLLVITRARGAGATAFRAIAPSIATLERRFGLNVNVLMLDAEEAKEKSAGDTLVTRVLASGRLITGTPTAEILRNVKSEATEEAPVINTRKWRARRIF